jgi:hypothetical protein
MEGAMRAVLRLAGLVAGVLLVATQVLVSTPASAQAVWPGGPGATTPLVPGQLFVGFGAQFEVYDLPRFDSPWRSANMVDPSPPRASDLWRPSWDPDPTVVGPGGVFGYVFREGTFPSWAGKKVRVSFGAQFWDGTANDRQSRPLTNIPGLGVTGTFVTAAPIDGSPGTELQPFGIGLFERVASFAVRATGYHLSLRLTSDYRVDTNLTLSPFISVFGGRSFDSYSLRALVTATTFDYAPYALDERVSTDRIGAMVGTGLTVPLDRRQRFRLHLGVQAGFVWLRSHLTGGDCFAGVSLPAPGTACGAAGAGFGSYQTSVTDTRSTVGFRGGLTAGASWDMGLAILSLTGFMTYDSQVPGIRNPVVTAPITTVGYGNQPTSGRAHIFFDDAVNFGGMVVLRIPFDAPHG